MLRRVVESAGLSEMERNASVSLMPQYSFHLPMEANFDLESSHKWLVDNFMLAVICSIIYVILVFFGEAYMKNRDAVQLKPALFVWNAMLAIFSIVAVIRLYPELIHGYMNFGFKHTMCSMTYYTGNQVCGFWSFSFTVSKLAELVDTLFLILRKRKVMVLHWFHHCSVLVFTWYIISNKNGVGRLFMDMNVLVHAIMYTYFALSALSIKLPKSLALCITSLQVLQMMVGLYISVRAGWLWAKGENCNISGMAAISGILIYCIYLVLFLDFFVKAYIRPKSRKEIKRS